ncbi:hypothetical protein [Sporosarcina sp. JAI121]|uniref:hypothetical protein n=1 Tax=Sporosarcina sp. JAI121 TaxID=2723064 RepID=UPI0015CD50B1|nr:hypothetical protein [Sporosarcina sp. JAI121]NYF23375.1 hypothetical protein [Sporosarcina sp. JAI121]
MVGLALVMIGWRCFMVGLAPNMVGPQCYTVGQTSDMVGPQINSYIQIKIGPFHMSIKYRRTEQPLSLNLKEK